MLSLAVGSYALMNPVSMPVNNVAVRAPMVRMDESAPAPPKPASTGGALSLSYAAAQARISAVVDIEPASTKSAAMCSRMTAENLMRIRDPDVGSNAAGPPLTEASGLGWDVSTEPKNKADMMVLANKLNPVL